METDMKIPLLIIGASLVAVLICAFIVWRIFLIIRAGNEQMDQFGKEDFERREN